MEDKRFEKIVSEAKFRRVPKKEQKVKIDSRFQSMFKNKKFNEEYTIDGRGRPVTHSTSNDLRRYYHLSSSEDTSDDENDNNQTKVATEKTKVEKPQSQESVPIDVKRKLKNLKVDYARGEQNLFSESSSDEESDVESDEGHGDDKIEHKWGELDAEADLADESTKRLAVCNMDWDRIRAVDIMVLLNSFLPPGGTIESVKIYISEFGKSRLKEEDVSGPPELRERKCEKRDEEESEEGSKYHMEKLRQYQLNRLKYYYAVVTFDKIETSSKVYSECDGIEYESSANKMDLRYIPDDMEFDDEPKEMCDKMPDMSKYQPRFFITTALQQAKVNLTWDETNPERIELTEKLNNGKLEDIDEAVLKNYLALSDEENDSDKDSGSENDSGDEDNDNPIEKYKALLLDIEEKEKEKQKDDIQMEVTWGLDLEKKSEELVKKKVTERENKTPFQQYLAKRKEKLKEKKKMRKQEMDNDSKSEESDIPSDIDMNDPYFAEEFNNSEKSKKKKNKKSKERTADLVDEQKQAELELLLMNNNDSENKKHFSLKQIQDVENKKDKKRKKNKKSEEIKDNFEVDVTDARFSAIYSSHYYNIDPSDSHYKKTKGMEQLIQEKLKRRIDHDEEVPTKSCKTDSASKSNAELNVLIKSVKRKAKAANKNRSMPLNRLNCVQSINDCCIENFGKFEMTEKSSNSEKLSILENNYPNPSDQQKFSGSMKLRALLNKTLKIEMSDGRVLIGIFFCTDADANVILGSCAEYLPQDIDGKKVNEEPRMLGLVMVPGKHIISISKDLNDSSSIDDNYDSCTDII